MGCGRNGRRSDWQKRMAGKFERKMSKWGMQAKAYQPTGNAAFDEYREDTLRRLEEAAEEFNDFLDRLRKARDRKQFEDFMQDRRNRGSRATDNGTPSAGGGSVPPMDPAPAT